MTTYKSGRNVFIVIDKRCFVSRAESAELGGTERTDRPELKVLDGDYGS